MPLMSKMIMEICIALGTLGTDMSPSCVEKMHVCMRDVFEVNFWDELDRPEKAILPFQLTYCRGEILLEQE